MKITKFKYDFSSFFLLEIILVSGMGICTIFGWHQMISLLFALTFIALFIYIVVDAFSNGLSIKLHALTIILVAFSVLNVLLDLFFEGGALSFDYIKKLIMFCSFMLLLSYAVREDTAVTDRYLQFIKLMPVVTALIFVVSFLFFGNKDEISGGIILGFSNPNATAMWLLHLLFFCVLFVLESIKHAKWGLGVAILLPILVYMIIRTRSRSCIIGLAAFVFLVLLGIFKRKPSKIVLFLIAIFPMLFAVAYLLIVDAEWFNSLFSFASGEGKPLSSRVDVWSDALEAFMKDPIVGTYYSISDGTGVSQLHNTHIDVLCSYGIVPAILFVKILYDSLKSVNKKFNSWYGYIAFCAFCSVIVVGAFEATIVAGSMGLNILTVSFLVLSRSGFVSHNSET